MPPKDPSTALLALTEREAEQIQDDRRRLRVAMRTAGVTADFLAATVHDALQASHDDGIDHDTRLKAVLIAAKLLRLEPPKEIHRTSKVAHVHGIVRMPTRTEVPSSVIDAEALPGASEHAQRIDQAANSLLSRLAKRPEKVDQKKNEDEPF